MADPLQEAIEALYRAPLGDFVAERKRLATELKASGSKKLSAEVAKLGRPSVSAWTVNQLWWQERETLAAFIDAAARMKRGERDASKLHRELLVKLRSRAGSILTTAGNAASETTLRRVTTTLLALAAGGGFAPDPDGALVADRDPPGFEALEGSTFSEPSAAPSEADIGQERAAETARRQAEQEQRERRLAEREQLLATLRDARELRETQQRELSRLRAELQAAEQTLKQTQDLLAEIEARLAKL